MVNNNMRLFLIMIVLAINPVMSLIYLDNCTFAIDIYRQHLNLLSSSHDSRMLHIQAVYTSSNEPLIPGHIYMRSSRSVALIPFFVRCSHPNSIQSAIYLPFSQCSSTVTTLDDELFWKRKNYESTRTLLDLADIWSMHLVPLLYSSEYRLLLSNCSFLLNSIHYQLPPDVVFSLRIEFESPMNTSGCRSCNRRTSICQRNTCQCRSGTIPMKLLEQRSKMSFCVDATVNCSFDSHRCLRLNPRSLFIVNETRSNPYFIFLTTLSILLFIIFVSLLWCLTRNPDEKNQEDKSRWTPNDPSIYIIDTHERTPSAASTSDSSAQTSSTKLLFDNEMLTKTTALDRHVLANEYVSTLYDDYPKIIGEKNNGQVVLILA